MSPTNERIHQALFEMLVEKNVAAGSDRSRCSRRVHRTISRPPPAIASSQPDRDHVPERALAIHARASRGTQRASGVKRAQT